MSKKSYIAQKRRNIKISENDTRAVLQLHPYLAPYKAAGLPLSKKLGEKAQAVYDKYLDNGIFGMAFFFVLVGFGIGIHYHKKFINLNKKNYLEFLGKKLGNLYPLKMIMQTEFLILE